MNEEKVISEYYRGSTQRRVVAFEDLMAGRTIEISAWTNEVVQ